MNVQETIQSFNAAGASGENPTQQQAPPAPSVQQPALETPDPPEPPAGQQPPKGTPPKNTTQPAPAALPSQQAPPDKNTPPPNPKFVDKNKATPARPAAASQQPAVPVEVSDESYYSRLSKETRGMIKDKKGWEDLIISHNQLVEEKERGFEPNYKDARTKWVHQLMLENAGKEPEAAMRTLRALQFKPEGKTPKDILYEQFLMDPKYAGATEKHFNAKFEKNYGILSKPLEELTPEQHQERLLAEMELNNAVAEAKASFQKVQDDFKATEEQPRRIDERVTKGINAAVKKFPGLKLSFSEDPQENEILNIPMEGDEEGLLRLEQDVLNPDAAYHERLLEFETDKGMDWDALVRDTYERNNHKELRQKTFDHAFKLGQLSQINQDNNASTPKELSQVAQTGGEAPNSFWGAAEAAFAKKKG